MPMSDQIDTQPVNKVPELWRRPELSLFPGRQDAIADFIDHINSDEWFDTNARFAGTHNVVLDFLSEAFEVMFLDRKVTGDGGNGT